MNVQRMYVHFNNECQRIGSGWRIVDVEVGRKWVKLKHGTRRMIVPKGLWEKVSEGATLLPAKKKRRRSPAAEFNRGMTRMFR